MYLTTLATSAALFLCAACPGLSAATDAGEPADAGPTDGGAADAGTADAGVLGDAGQACLNPGPTPDGQCPPGCSQTEVNIETQADLEAFAVAPHTAPLDTVNIFSSDGQVDPIVDITPLADVALVARALELRGPSTSQDIVFSRLSVTGLLIFSSTGALNVSFPGTTSVESIAIGGAVQRLSFPSLEQVLHLQLQGTSALCNIDLGATSLADVCDLSQRDQILADTCTDGVLSVSSCCAFPFR